MANKKYSKRPPLTLVQQKIRIRQLYSELVDELIIEKSELICKIKLQPSVHSEIYEIKIKYKISDGSPKAWLINPEMRAFEGKYPHHVYGTDRQGHYRLCVYSPMDKNWNQDMLIAESFIPWVCTWLNSYEYWLITGKWHYDEAFSDGNKRKRRQFRRRKRLKRHISR